MELTRTAALAGVLVLAGCGSSSQRSSAPKGVCSSLTTKDVGALIHSDTQARALAALPGQRLLCGTIFAGQAGEIAVSLTERKGTAAAFERQRRADVGQYGGFHRLPSLGSEAFAAGARVVAFRRRDTIVRLESGFRPSGPALTLRQLERLARTVEGRI